MSVTKSKFTDLRGVDIVTGVNSACVIYLYYSLTSLGQELNNKIVRLTTILKRLNKNINITDRELKRHIIEYIKDYEDTDREALDEEFKKEVLLKIQQLEERLSIYETINNPIITKYANGKKDVSPAIVQRHEGEKTSVIY